MTNVCVYKNKIKINFGKIFGLDLCEHRFVKTSLSISIAIFDQFKTIKCRRRKLN